MIYYSLEQANLKNSIVTIGVFDGVHQGHQWLLNHLIKSKQQKMVNSKEIDYRTVVITFDPHPAEVLFGKDSDFYLSTIDRKIEKLLSFGVDDIIVVPFTKETSNMSSHYFIEKLVKYVDLKELWVGDDFALGKDRSGTIPALKELGKEFGFDVHMLAKKSNHDLTYSSSVIRKLLKDGELKKANQYLGNPFQLVGEIVVGDQRGRTIGFPTANIAVDQRLLIPKFGVYAAKAFYQDKSYNAVVNIGIRPTFDSTELRIEAHLLEFPSIEIYGEQLTLKFHEFIREEVKFDSLDALMNQIEEDCKTAASVLP